MAGGEEQPFGGSGAILGGLHVDNEELGRRRSRPIGTLEEATMNQRSETRR